VATFYSENFNQLSAGNLIGQDSWTFGNQLRYYILEWTDDDQRSPIVEDDKLKLHNYHEATRPVTTTGDIITLRWMHYIDSTTDATSIYERGFRARLFDGSAYIQALVTRTIINAGTATNVSTPASYVGTWVKFTWQINMDTNKASFWANQTKLIDDEAFSPAFAGTNIDAIGFWATDGAIYKMPFDNSTWANGSALHGKDSWSKTTTNSPVIIASPVYSKIRACEWRSGLGALRYIATLKTETYFEFEFKFYVRATTATFTFTTLKANHASNVALIISATAIQWSPSPLKTTSINRLTWYKVKVRTKASNLMDCYVDDQLIYADVSNAALNSISFGGLLLNCSASNPTNQGVVIDDIVIRELA